MTPSITQTGLIEPFELQVARGQVAGHSLVQLSGYNGDVDTTWETLWSNGTITFPTVATVMKVSSSAAADTNTSGTGAWTVRVTGLDSNYNVISETLALNGQTAVNTVNSYLRINGFAVTETGTDKTAAGTIYIGDGVVTAGVPATVYDEIPVEWNARQTAVFTIPAGFTGYITYSRLTFAQASGTNAVWGRLLAIGTNGVPMATVAVVANNGVIEFQPKYPIRVPEKTMIRSEVKGTAANNYASTVVQLVLIQD